MLTLSKQYNPLKDLWERMYLRWQRDWRVSDVCREQVYSWKQETDDAVALRRFDFPLCYSHTSSLAAKWPLLLWLPRERSIFYDEFSRCFL